MAITTSAIGTMYIAAKAARSGPDMHPKPNPPHSASGVALWATAMSRAATTETIKPAQTRWGQRRTRERGDGATSMGRSYRGWGDGQPTRFCDDGLMNPLEVVTAFGDAWARHDLEEALAMITDDCVFDATGPAPDGVRHVGRDAISKAWQGIFDDPSSRFDAEDTFAAGDRVVQLWRYSWSEDGRVAEKLSYVKG